MDFKPRLPYGMTRTPWGFTVGHDGVLVATSATADRWRRAEMGEAAIKILAALGINGELLEELSPIDDPVAILDRLKEART